MGKHVLIPKFEKPIQHGIIRLNVSVDNTDKSKYSGLLVIYWEFNDEKLLLMVCSALYSLTFFSNSIAQNNDLCIGLLNRSAAPVFFMGSSDPGGNFPQVIPNYIGVLGGDYWVTCTTSCWAMVWSNDPPGDTTIYNIPRGALIIYYGPNNYALDKDARIKCSWEMWWRLP